MALLVVPPQQPAEHGAALVGGRGAANQYPEELQEVGGWRSVSGGHQSFANKIDLVATQNSVVRVAKKRRWQSRPASCCAEPGLAWSMRASCQGW